MGGGRKGKETKEDGMRDRNEREAERESENDYRRTLSRRKKAVVYPQAKKRAKRRLCQTKLNNKNYKWPNKLKDQSFLKGNPLKLQ